MRTNDTFKHILTRDEEIKDAASKIDNATPLYNRMERNKILSKTVRAIKSPYFHKYRDLQKICRMILLREKIKYDSSANKIYGILFDGAWLWEEYLATILKGKGFIHSENKIRKGGKRMFQNDNSEEYANNYRIIYPDFYREGENGCVLDAKYKNLDGGFKREDIYQVVTYMHVLNIEKGYFIYPTKNKIEEKPSLLKGLGGYLGKIGIQIPQEAQSLKDFTDKMNQNCEFNLMI